MEFNLQEGTIRPLQPALRPSVSGAFPTDNLANGFATVQGLPSQSPTTLTFNNPALGSAVPAGGVAQPQPPISFTVNNTTGGGIQLQELKDLLATVIAETRQNSATTVTPTPTIVVPPPAAALAPIAGTSRVQTLAPVVQPSVTPTTSIGQVIGSAPVVTPITLPEQGTQQAGLVRLRPPLSLVPVTPPAPLPPALVPVPEVPVALTAPAAVVVTPLPVSSTTKSKLETEAGTVGIFGQRVPRWLLGTIIGAILLSIGLGIWAIMRQRNKKASDEIRSGKAKVEFLAAPPNTSGAFYTSDTAVRQPSITMGRDVSMQQPQISRPIVVQSSASSAVNTVADGKANVLAGVQHTVDDEDPRSHNTIDLQVHTSRSKIQQPLAALYRGLAQSTPAPIDSRRISVQREFIEPSFHSIHGDEQLQSTEVQAYIIP